MLNKLGLVAASLSVLAMAACGGSDGGSDRDDAPSFTELTTRHEAMQTRVAAMEDTVTLPTEGSATYQGSGAFDIGRNGENDMLADLRLEADFNANEVGGKFSNFVGSDGRQIGGELTVEPSTVNVNAFDATATGTLNDGTAQDVDMTMAGVFHGAGADAVAGSMNGTIGSENLGGNFVAEKK